MNDEDTNINKVREKGSMQKQMRECKNQKMRMNEKERANAQQFQL